MIVLARIDDRLIHGQVIEGWVNFLKATCIIVADDGVAANERQCSIMRLSVPEGLKLSIGTVEDLCRALGSPAFERERVIVLFSSPVDAVRAFGKGLSCRTLNIGGLHFTPGKCKLLDVLAVDDADRGALEQIMERGVKVDIQTVPTEKPMPLSKVLGGSCKT